MKNRTRIMIMVGILAACLAAGLLLCNDDARTYQTSLLITSSHTQMSYDTAMDSLVILSESLDHVMQLGQPGFEQVSLAMLSNSLYSLTITAHEPLDEKLVQAFAVRLLQVYDQKVRQAFKDSCRRVRRPA